MAVHPYPADQRRAGRWRRRIGAGLHPGIARTDRGQSWPLAAPDLKGRRGAQRRECGAYRLDGAPRSARRADEGKPAADAASGREPARAEARTDPARQRRREFIQDDGLRAHLRNIEAYVARLSEDMAQGREQSVHELRNEIRILARTIASIAEEARS